MQSHSDNQNDLTASEERVLLDDSPSLQIWLSADELRCVLNRSAHLFFATDRIVWTDVLAGNDKALWQAKLQVSLRDQTPMIGCFKVKRFDNAIRTFALRAEPRYGSEGQFTGHVISGLDISEFTNEQDAPAKAIPAAPAAPTGHSSEVRQLAEKWHDALVSSVTVLTISIDLIPDIIAQNDTVRLNELLARIGHATEDIRTQISIMNMVARNQDIQGCLEAS